MVHLTGQLTYIRLYVQLTYIGATLSKGLNRALATLVASSLAVGAREVASLVAARSEKAESVILAVFVFFVGMYADYY
jgi:hypothetical protein